MDKIIRNLFFIQENLCLEQLEQIYDDYMASHLWNKFIYYDRNLLLFINYLDKDNKDKFFNALNNNIFFDINSE